MLPTSAASCEVFCEPQVLGYCYMQVAAFLLHDSNAFKKLQSERVRLVAAA